VRSDEAADGEEVGDGDGSRPVVDDDLSRLARWADGDRPDDDARGGGSGGGGAASPSLGFKGVLRTPRARRSSTPRLAMYSSRDVTPRRSPQPSPLESTKLSG